ncbi:MFS transporter [Chengkuizengella sediminis]|uniref:MFS transporter n=1 Tax=Chengkuizengella sediminis TaxID=1885917 RepID=UPI0013897ED5|nr:MFS transporter [Chengkuizengella sediminis]NDI36028.1 NarK/NasA family nitrate transporter [Chengkuizengella sediminis]
MTTLSITNRPTFQLSLQTFSLVSSFMVWVILSSLMPFISQDLNLTATQITWITSAPVISGSLLRIPMGYYTGKFGASKVFIFNFIALIIPVYLISTSTSFIALFSLGLLIGISGATFSIGVTSLPKYYAKEKHGFVNGIFGLGNIGTAFTSFLAPVLANLLGWRLTIQLYLILIIFMIFIHFFFADKTEQTTTEKFINPINFLRKNKNIFVISLFYFLTFGTFVTFTVMLPTLLVSVFELSEVDAGLITAIFIIIATLIRPVGGILGDKFNPYFLLVIVFTTIGLSSLLLSLVNEYNIFIIAIMILSLSSGIGNGVVFKVVPMVATTQTGVANGIVAATGSFGGFIPPLVIGFIIGATNSYTIGFILFSILSAVCLIIILSKYNIEN